MPTIGLDCQLVLDGTGYFIEPESFRMTRMRVRRSDLNRAIASGGSGAGERYLDHGPGKREWTFTVTCFNTIRKYDGSMVPNTYGQTQRDALHASYQKVKTTLAFTDPNQAAWTVHFDELLEDLFDVRTQIEGTSGLGYYVHVTLVEA